MVDERFANTIPLSQTTRFIVDNRGRTAPTAETGIPLIATNCITNDRLYPAHENLRFVSRETYNTWFRSHPQPGDIILTNKGSQNGAICLVPDPVDFVIAQDMVALRANEDVIDPLFLFAALRSPDAQRQIKNLDVSGVIPHFKKTDFDKLDLPYPSRDDQKTIGRIYFDFCAKIELNRRINATLEAMARALFQSWFVDFDPVRVKLDGSPPTGLDPATAALFPEHFQDSPLGPIPQGWSAGCIGDIATNSRRGIQPNDIAANTPYIALDHMPRRSIALGDWDDSADVASGKFAFRKGEILFGKLRPYFHKVGVAPVGGICSTDILILSPKSPECFGFLLCHASSDALIQFTDLASTGTKMPRTNWSDISSFKVALPPKPLAHAFNRIITPMIERIIANIHQSRTLAALRDALLPKLLNGEFESNADGVPTGVAP